MNVLSITDLHDMRLLLLVHKCTYHGQLCPGIFHEYFTTVHSVHYHNTRRNNDLCLTRMNSVIGQRYSLYNCSKLWNLLPYNVKLISSVVILKRTIMKLLLYRNCDTSLLLYSCLYFNFYFFLVLLFFINFVINSHLIFFY